MDGEDPDYNYNDDGDNNKQQNNDNNNHSNDDDDDDDDDVNSNNNDYANNNDNDNNGISSYSIVGYQKGEVVLQTFSNVFVIGISKCNAMHLTQKGRNV